MKIRMNDNEERESEIRQQRSNKDRWIQAVVAALAAGATYLGGSTYIQLQDVQTNPMARADPFSGSDGAALEQRMNDRIAQKSEFNRARWDEVAKHLEVQHAVMESLRSSVEQILSRCAQAQAKDESLQAQITDIREDHRETRKLLYNHLGMTNGQNSHKK